MKWLDKDEVTGDWYLYGWSLNPWVWVDLIIGLFYITRWFWYLAFAFMLGWFMGSTS